MRLPDQLFTAALVLTAVSAFGVADDSDVLRVLGTLGMFNAGLLAGLAVEANRG